MKSLLHQACHFLFINKFSNLSDFRILKIYHLHQSDKVSWTRTTMTHSFGAYRQLKGHSPCSNLVT